MGHKNKESLTRQTERVLSEKCRFGESRDKAKKDKSDKDGIYSYSTFAAYLKWCYVFVHFCLDHYKCKTLMQCRQYVDEWLTTLIGRCAPSTVKLAASALAKLYGCSAKGFIHTPDRRRADIKRSRGPKERDRHFSEENHRELVDFCKSTGLRRHELYALRGTDLVCKNGRWYVHVKKGKGGKERLAQIVGNVQSVIDVMHKAGGGKVFPKVPEVMDVHGYRREYATAFYKILVRPLDKLPEKELYRCRGDKKGVVYDRWAMLTVSKSLGHNRIDVIAGHYLD